MSKKLTDIERILASNLPDDLKERTIRDLMDSPREADSDSSGVLPGPGRPRMSIPKYGDMKKCPECDETKEVFEYFGLQKKTLTDGTVVKRPMSWCIDCRTKAAEAARDKSHKN